MNKQQTAVDWLFEQLTEVDYNCINKTFLQNNKSLAGHKLRELFQQAKKLEKQQIINIAYKQIENCHIELGEISYSKVPEELFTETFE